MRQPIEFNSKNGGVIAGLVDASDGAQFTMVFLHEPGKDLDAMLPILAHLGLSEARKVALDLPGHGLSSGDPAPGCIGPALNQVLDDMLRRGWAPFLLVAAGEAALHAIAVADAAHTMGLCLLAPRRGDGLVTGTKARCPILAFVSSCDESGLAEWSSIRNALHSRWMTISIAVDHEALVTGDESVVGQVASHLQGFARDLYVTSPLLAGRTAREAGQ